jgi:hypothetical protein
MAVKPSLQRRSSRCPRFFMKSLACSAASCKPANSIVAVVEMKHRSSSGVGDMGEHVEGLADCDEMDVSSPAPSGRTWRLILNVWREFACGSRHRPSPRVLCAEIHGEGHRVMLPPRDPLYRPRA